MLRSGFLPKDSWAFADDSVLKQQRDHTNARWPAYTYAKLLRMLYVHAYVRVFLVVAAQGDKETHSGPL